MIPEQHVPFRGLVDRCSVAERGVGASVMVVHKAATYAMVMVTISGTCRATCRYAREDPTQIDIIRTAADHVVVCVQRLHIVKDHVAYRTRRSAAAQTILLDDTRISEFNA